MDSDHDVEEYIVHGTPLPDIDDETIVSKKANQDLSVRDEKGRQRFHGAFTGGFSAGYFNTVGTKEGWEPATFSSSRSSKTASISFQQKPEDFMDDEDFGEFGIAPKKIRTTSNFCDSNSDIKRKRKHISDVDAVIPGEPPLKELIKPVVESIGISILKKMGWRQGQGIGPRSKKKQKVISCSLGPLGCEEADPVLDLFAFAPDDIPDISYLPKDDYHGIGYTGLSTQSILNVPLSPTFSNSRTKSWLAKDRKKLSISGQAFGVGALEDDDDDIYVNDDMSQYDFSEFTNNEQDQKRKNNQNTRTECNLVVCLVDGFHLTKKPQTKKKHYPLPDIPPDFQPYHKVNCKLKKSNEVAKCNLNPALRSVLLGEKAFIKSVSQAKKSERVSRFDQAPTVPVVVQQPGAPKLVSNPTLSVPPLLRMTFKPFTTDSMKQKRYEEFLKHSCNKDYLKGIQPSTLTEWEKQRELDEFTTAANFFQPIPKELELRFESLSHLDVSSGLLDVKEKNKSVNSPKTESQITSGPHRKVMEWHPVSLLCKRFNVPNPYPDSKYDGVLQVEKKKPSLFDPISFCEDVQDKLLTSEAEGQVSENSPDEMTESIEKEADGSTELDKTNSQPQIECVKSLEESEYGKKKPPMDLFKEIFQNSSSEDTEPSDDETSKTEIPSAPLSSGVLNSPVEKTAGEVSASVDNSTVGKSEIPSIKCTKKQAFGVFANLDLDALNKRNVTADKITTNQLQCEGNNVDNSAKFSEIIQNSQSNLTEVGNDSFKSSLADDGYYGPELPPSGIVPQISGSGMAHHKHSKHKHKHHKHKEKKKKKRKKHRHSMKEKDDDSSTDSEEEISPHLIVEKLKKLQNSSRNGRN